MNVGLGAFTAALRARLAGRSLWPALTKGAAGGVINYTGKRILGTRDPSFRLLGRELAAVGASVVANGGDGRAPFASAILPFGPAHFYVARSGVHVKLDLPAAIMLVYTATQPHTHLELGASLKAGTPIFTNVVVHADFLRGFHRAVEEAGVIGVQGKTASALLLAHELVHVAQYDFTFIAWGEPIERALVPTLPAGAFVHRYVDIGANMPFWWLGHWVIPYTQRPWEREAYLMATGTP